jgi:arabinofuranosyltransferase
VFTGIALTTVGLLFAQGGAARLHAVPDASFAERLKGSLPVGAAIFAVLPPAWDYASSGLETGLGLAWLGASYLALAAQIRQDAARSTGVAGGSWCAVLLGVGPLIRPEFVLYAVVPLGILSWAVGVRAGPSPRSCLLAVARIASCALAAPFAYQIFRMGYYAGIAPNTAIAKEAFLANWSQGACYFDNFFGTYKMVVPLSAAAILARALARPRGRAPLVSFAATMRRRSAAVASCTSALGGDYACAHVRARGLRGPAAGSHGAAVRANVPRGASRPRRGRLGHLRLAALVRRAAARRRRKRVHHRR